MDAKKTGLFICLLRKQKGMTQAELAGRIGVTDKAVSRWETGKGFPDISLLPPLAEALGTSVTELLAGEPMSTEERAERSDSAALEALRYARSMGRNTAAVLLGVAGVFLLFTPLFMAGRTWGLAWRGWDCWRWLWRSAVSGSPACPVRIGGDSSPLPPPGSALPCAWALPLCWSCCPMGRC